MKSQLFYSDGFKSVEFKLKEFLNSQSKEKLGINTSSVRTSGDQIPSVINSEISSILGRTVEVADSRKSMYNFSFKDSSKINYYVNVLTHRIETKFNMPNITSVDRLIKLYENDENYFIILMISYEASKAKDFIKKIHFKPVEFFSWDCLGLGALGSGQIQIKKAKNVLIESNPNRREWMIEFSDRLTTFYVDEMKKTVNRLDRTDKLRVFWKSKTKLGD